MVAPSNRNDGNNDESLLGRLFAERRGELFIIAVLLIFYYSSIYDPQSKSSHGHGVGVGSGGGETGRHHHHHGPTAPPLPTDEEGYVQRQLENKKVFKKWRKETKTDCKLFLDKVKRFTDDEAMHLKQHVDVDGLEKLYIPAYDDLSEQPLEYSKEYDPFCKHAVIDIGTGIGNFLGYYLEGAYDVCTPMWRNEDTDIQFWLDSFPRVSFDLHELAFHTYDHKHNLSPYSRFISETLDEHKVRHEDVCLYGVEGNNIFNGHLQRFENFLYEMWPTSFQHVHIFKETVITDKDGPINFYIDRVAESNFFWGSSIIDNLKLAREHHTLKYQDKSILEIVNGISFSTMLKRTMATFRNDDEISPLSTAEGKNGNNKNDDVDDDDTKSGGLLIVNIDANAAEYRILKEVANTGILCDYISRGNHVVMLVKTHPSSWFINSTEYDINFQGYENARKLLTLCGVKFEDINDWM